MSPQSPLERYEKRSEWWLGGITLLGTVTATLASWIVQRVSEEDTASNAATAAEIDALRDEVRQLTEAVRARRESDDESRMEGNR